MPEDPALGILSLSPEETRTAYSFAMMGRVDLSRLSSLARAEPELVKLAAKAWPLPLADQANDVFENECKGLRSGRLSRIYNALIC